MPGILTSHAFVSRPQQAFNYSISDTIPTVPYATVFEQFINCNFLVVILVGSMVFAFSWQYFNQRESYRATVESSVGFSLFMVWILGNLFFWAEIYARKRKWAVPPLFMLSCFRLPSPCLHASLHQCATAVMIMLIAVNTTTTILHHS